MSKPLTHNLRLAYARACSSHPKPYKSPEIPDMSCSLNSLQGGYIRSIIGVILNPKPQTLNNYSPYSAEITDMERSLFFGG